MMQEMWNELPAVVIDNGSSTCKVGISGEDAPNASFSTITGKLKIPGSIVGMDQKDIYAGEEALAIKDQLNLNHPIRNGIIQDLDDMEAIWHHCYFNVLKVAPEEHPAFLTEPPMNPKDHKEALCQIFFEKFDVPSFYVGMQALLSLYGSGRTSGMVVESGDCATYVVPIIEACIQAGFQRIDMSGRDLTNYMMKLLLEVGISSSEITARDIKEKYCYFPFDEWWNPDSKEMANKEVPYTLPDGKVITIVNEQFTCPEALFQPSKIGKTSPGIHELTFNSIMKAGMDKRRELFNTILLAGGNTMFKGMDDRMQKEIVALALPGYKIKVIAPPERKILAWIGGSVLSSLSTFQSMWITKAEFDESGPAIVHRKCAVEQTPSA
jgi:actin-related protein